MNRLKIANKFMLGLYRFSKSSYVLSPFFWLLALTGLFYPFLAPVYGDIGIIPRKDILIGMAFTYALGLIIVLSIGFLYERVLRLYNVEIPIAYERNPYTHRKLTEKELIIYEHFWIPVMDGLEKEDESNWLRECVKKGEIVDFGERDV